MNRRRSELKVATILTTIVSEVIVCMGCARIDNNRREYWVERLRKMVYMRVCSVFFFLCCTIVQVCK